MIVDPGVARRSSPGFLPAVPRGRERAPAAASSSENQSQHYAGTEHAISSM